MRELTDRSDLVIETGNKAVDQLSFLSRFQKYLPLKQLVKCTALVGFGVLSYLGLNSL